VVKDEKTGEIIELHCTHDPESRGGGTPDGRRVKGTLHWVSVPHAIEAEVRLFEHLFTKPDPEKDADLRANLNPNSMTILTGCKLEPSLADATPENRYQFLRHGYFCVDSVDSARDKLVFNRTVSLRDTWAKMGKK
jgi:glutaminyl-tRNA synthetase